MPYRLLPFLPAVYRIYTEPAGQTTVLDFLYLPYITTWVTCRFLYTFFLYHYGFHYISLDAIDSTSRLPFLCSWIATCRSLLFLPACVLPFCRSGLLDSACHNTAGFLQLWAGFCLCLPAACLLPARFHCTSPHCCLLPFTAAWIHLGFTCHLPAVLLGFLSCLHCCLPASLPAFTLPGSLDSAGLNTCGSAACYLQGSALPFCMPAAPGFYWVHRSLFCCRFLPAWVWVCTRCTGFLPATCLGSPFSLMRYRPGLFTTTIPPLFRCCSFIRSF